MEFDNIRGSQKVITILKYVGLWRLSQNTPGEHLYTVYSYILHFTLSFPYTLMMWVALVQSSNLEKFSNIMYMSLTELALLVKIINVWLNSKVLVRFFYEMANDETFRLHSNVERKFWSRSHIIYCRTAFIYFTMSITAVMNAFIGVLFAKDYELPFPYAPPFDWQTEQGYWYAYYYELVAMPLTCLSNCGLDMIQCYMLLHLAMCYKLIAMRMEEMGKPKNAIFLGKEFSEKAFLEDLLDIAKLHYKTKKLCKDCETFVSFPILIQIMVSSFVLCFCVYRLQKLNILEDTSQFYTIIMAVLIMALQIFLPCYFGNEVTLNSSALNSAIYKAEWVQCTPKMRKYLTIYMEMLQSPTKMRACNFFEIGLPIFVKTINNTYSLMALLLNMNK